MTAEIAILNKMAVALAADSAVTIGRPPNIKIYNTVNKIFELSSCEPVGIMVYGRLDFMGVPYEPLIKEYRRSIGDLKFDYIGEYVDHFKEYLKTITFSEEESRKNIVFCLADRFSELSQDIESALIRRIRDDGKFLKSKINGMAQTAIRAEITKLQRASFANGFNRVVLPTGYTGVVDILIDRHFEHHYPNKATRELLHKLAGYLLAKDELSGSRTGIVIAGFGQREMLPTLISFETDGIIDGKLKWHAEPAVDIKRSGPEAEILGFAQDDMIRSFLDGVDPYLRDYFEELIESSIRTTTDMLFGAFTNSDDEKGRAINAFEGTLKKIVADLKDKADEKIKTSSSNPIRDMIRSMPKQELATLATSLVEVTSLKRKVSRMQETVGGEVDVAVISKSEGFVWIQRKHYFPSELNGRFFVRQKLATEQRR
ncbi:MAG: hypothetical protein R3E02_16250 [Blastomonas sp.]